MGCIWGGVLCNTFCTPDHLHFKVWTNGVSGLGFWVSDFEGSNLQLWTTVFCVPRGQVRVWWNSQDCRFPIHLLKWLLGWFDDINSHSCFFFFIWIEWWVPQMGGWVTEKKQNGKLHYTNHHAGSQQHEFSPAIDVFETQTFSSQTNWELVNWVIMIVKYKIWWFPGHLHRRLTWAEYYLTDRKW